MIKSIKSIKSKHRTKRRPMAVRLTPEEAIKRYDNSPELRRLANQVADINTRLAITEARTMTLDRSVKSLLTEGVPVQDDLFAADQTRLQKRLDEVTDEWLAALHTLKRIFTRVNVPTSSMCRKDFEDIFDDIEALAYDHIILADDGKPFNTPEEF